MWWILYSYNLCIHYSEKKRKRRWRPIWFQCLFFSDWSRCFYENIFKQLIPYHFLPQKFRTALLLMSQHIHWQTFHPFTVGFIILLDGEKKNPEFKELSIEGYKRKLAAVLIKSVIIQLKNHSIPWEELFYE